MGCGVFSLAELQQLGYNDWAVRKQVRDGSLMRLRAGWYAIPTAVPAAMDAVRLGGGLACVSALRWHGLWIAPGYDGVHVRFSKHGKQSGRSGCQGYGAQEPVVTAVDPVTTALRYAAKCMAAEDWITACDSALNKAGQTVSGLQAEMGPIPKAMHLLMEKCDRKSQSGTESLARLRLRAAGFKVITQPPILGVGRVDLRVGRLLIECDSKDHHTSLADYQNDRRRDRAALRGKWLTMRITYDDVLYGWDAVLDDVRAITRSDRHRMRP